MGSFIKMTSRDARVMMYVQEEKIELFSCAACGHTFEQSVLFQRTEDESLPFTHRPKSYELDPVVCPECLSDMIEVVGPTDIREQAEALKEDWLENYSRRRIETAVARKCLYPEYRDERGYVDTLTKPLAQVLWKPKRKELDGFLHWICFRKSGVLMEIYPTENVVSSAGITRCIDAIRNGLDWENWFFTSRQVTWINSAGKEETYKKVSWIQVTLPLEILDKADITAVMNAINFHHGVEEMCKGTRIRGYRALKEALAVAGVPPELSGIDNPKHIRALSKCKLTPEQVGLQMICFANGEDFTSDEAFIIQSAVKVEPEKDQISTYCLNPARRFA